MTHVTSLVTENPFHNYTARADVPDFFNLTRPNQEALNQVIKFLNIIQKKKRQSVVLPIIAEAGYGKTHFYWVLRQQLTDAYVVYIPVPTNPNRVYSHFYFETVKAGGAPLLEYIADTLTTKYSKVEHAAIDFSGMGNIVVEAFFALKDPKQSKVALKWLTGFDIDEETVNFKRTIMDDEELAFAALKLILKIIDKPIVFFVDELESLFIALGPEAELQFLETLKKMHNEAVNFILCLSCLATLWDKILDLSSTAVQSRIEPPVVLKRFSKKDIKLYCLHMLKDFHQKFEMLFSEKESLWPLKDSDIESAYAYSHGNPREAIKWLNSVIEERKLPIIHEVKKNHEFLTKTSLNLKKILKKAKSKTTGVFHRNNGVFISLPDVGTRTLITIAPMKEVDVILQQSYWISLKNFVEKEEYEKVLLIGDIDKKTKLTDVEIKTFAPEDIGTQLLDQIKS
ncbi:MAG: P-loop NTPase fold protein [Candidatus Hodarchaeales archaeon]